MSHAAKSAGLVVLALLAALLAGCGQTRPGAPLALDPVAALPRSQTSHVVVIVMENKEASDVIGNQAAPYENELARRYGLATQSYAITHPSLPNYLALTSGSTHGVNSDSTDCHVGARNIVDQLDAAGIPWRAYLEDVPRRCFTGAGAGGYAKKHNPFIYYDDIANSPSRCRNLVGFSALAADLRRGTLPTYAWVSPNLCDDTHDCAVATGDRFLARLVPALLREIGPQGFVVITWDEGSSGAGCCGGAAAGGRIATIVAGPQVRRGARATAPVDHYGVLGTIEDALGLPPLGGAADPRNGRLDSLFARSPKVRSAVG
jgi:hypothetical protein